MRRFLTTLALAATLAIPSLALADPPDDRDDSEPDRRDELLDRVRIVRAAALAEALVLDEATAARLFPYLRDTDNAMEEIHLARREHQQALRRMAKDDAFPEAEVEAHISALGELDVRLAQARADQLAGLRPILTAEQRVKFIVVQKRLEREIRRMMLEERGRHRDGEGRERRERRREHLEDDEF